MSVCSAVTVCGTVKIKMHLWVMKAGVMLLDKSIKLICVLTCGFVSFSADVLSGRRHYYLGTLRKIKCCLNVVFTIYWF